MKPGSPTSEDLQRLARVRLDDAISLYKAGRYEGSVYLCGYVVELALKARICKHLGWYSYPSDIQNLKTHSFEMLLRFTGMAEEKERFIEHWNLLTSWTPEMRYDADVTFDESEAELRINSARKLLGIFL